MESAYTLANRELKQRREANQKEQQRRVMEVRGLSPRFGEIEKKLAEYGAALAQCVLKKNGDYASVEAGIRDLQEQKRRILRQLSLAEDYVDDIHTCLLCRDTGFDQNGRRCGCLLQLISKYTGVNANLTEFMKEQTFDRFDFSLFAQQPEQNGRLPLTYIKTAYEKGLRFAETFETTHQNLLLMGNAGTGKTYLSGCIANDALRRGRSVYYQTAFSLLDTMERVKFDRVESENAEQAAAAVQHARTVELLILDDLGTEFISTYSTAALFELINARLLQKKSTVLSTNLSIRNIEDVYGRRLLSRLYGYFEIIPFIGCDLRMTKREERM